jgi:hypothetical protein
MVKYKTRPAEVDARQYTGGQTNGQELEAWINSIGGDATWSPENDFKDLTIAEELHLGQSKLHMNWNVPIGHWLVYQDDFLSIHPDVEFQKRYMKDED